MPTVEEQLAEMREQLGVMTEALRDVGELKTGTQGLTEQVATLSVALQVVNQLQRNQQEIERRATDAAHAAKVLKEDVAENVVPKMTIEKKWVEQAKTMKNLRNQVVGALAAAIIVALMIGATFYVVGHNQLTQFKGQRVAVCQASNQQKIAASEATRKQFQPFLLREQAEAHPDPVLVEILSGLTSTRPIITNCVGSTNPSR